MIHTCILLFNFSLHIELILISTSLELEWFGLYHFRSAAIDVCLLEENKQDHYIVIYTVLIIQLNESITVCCSEKEAHNLTDNLPLLFLSKLEKYINNLAKSMLR